MPEGSILVVDDEQRQREVYRDIFLDEGYETVTAPSGEAALRLLAQKRFDLVLTDLNLAGMTGIELLTQILQTDPTVAIVLITGYPSIESAIDATKRGVYQYLEKPVDRSKLLEVVGDALGHLASLKQTIIGHSPAIREMVRMVMKVAPTAHTVLILGESGTGKELVAREIHKHSPRNQKPFLAVNCASLTETLLESELFGHEKGAFTDAYQQKKGLFERADHSTLFLDEIGDTSLAMQAKILRALQEREILRVGGTESIKVDVRIIAATNRNLDQLMQEGKFREDLYYRLKVIPIICPPLREHRDDIEELALHFMGKAGLASGRGVHSISEEALGALKAYRWPGNVRQLEWAIERAVVLGESDRVDLQDLPPEILQTAEEISSSEPAISAPQAGAARFTPVIPETTWEEHEKAKITEALQRTNGNITRAAQLLGMTFRTLQYRLEKFGIRKQ
ncbi:MAG: sigma-54-dependent Fis family transcriptional regulator [Acidobacteria bacterium]|nr:MAG: sigma-54-dependent Fis family transcriptional regulator [Acidobacteriota bacterium]